MSKPTLQTPIKKFMTPSPFRVEETTSIASALRTMETEGIRHLPVTRQNKLVGLLSNRDIVVFVSKGHPDLSKTMVKEAMTLTPYCVAPETSLSDVTSQMANHKYGSVVVVEKEQVVGIFTTVDAMRVLHEICVSEANYSS